MDTRLIGNIGEKLAQEYLINKKYQIIHKNWTCQAGELDIIAEKDGKLVFIEVKNVRNKFCKPHELLTSSKIKHLHRSIQQYLLKNDTDKNNWRLDLITISNNKLNHYKNIKDSLLRWY